MLITPDDFLLNCYLSLLEYEYNPQIENKDIVFTYNDLPITISKADNKRGEYIFAIYNVTDAKKKNKAIVQRFINESYQCDCVSMRIEIDESVTIYIISQLFSGLDDLNMHIRHFCEILESRYIEFMEKIILRYGE
ncbi:MAG: hypothetical protein E6772_10325 [Dysgonomonas sp.]|nr:hypothetical protein [Dysgonomonas sp.]